jgi:hypothetical protein
MGYIELRANQLQTLHHGRESDSHGTLNSAAKGGKLYTSQMARRSANWQQAIFLLHRRVKMLACCI